MTEKLPPRWFIRTAWVAHRALYRITRGRVGLARPTEGGRFGMLRLHAIGRRTGEERIVILGYYEDGPNLVTLAMNGWGTAAPAWSLNLRANPDAEVDLVDGTRRIRSRVADGAERDLLWAVVGAVHGWGDDLDALAALRARQTDVVVLAPR